MTQTRTMSFMEAVANVIFGYGLALVTQILVFPAFGFRASLGDNLLLGAVFTGVSLTRSYAVRRVFERWRIVQEEQSAAE